MKVGELIQKLTTLDRNAELLGFDTALGYLPITDVDCYKFDPELDKDQHRVFGDKQYIIIS